MALLNIHKDNRHSRIAARDTLIKIYNSQHIDTIKCFMPISITIYYERDMNKNGTFLTFNDYSY